MTTTLDTASARRVTPTGVRVTLADADRTDWLAARRHGITATDIVKIVGASKYGSAIDVYADKVGEPLVEDEALSEAGEWGQELEDYVARRWAERNGVTVRRIGLIAHQDDPWMLASLDRLVVGCDLGRCGAEIKTTGAWLADQWEDGIPERVDVQVQWQLAVSGLDHMHVAALIGGQRLVEHTIWQNEQRIARLTAAGALVWAAVVAGTPPEIDPELMTVELLERVYPERDGAKVIDGDIARQLLTEYAEAGAGEKAFKDTKERIKVELLTLLGDGEEAVDQDGASLFTYRAQAKRSTDLKRLEAEYPVAFAAVVSSSTSRTFRPAKGVTGA